MRDPKTLSQKSFGNVNLALKSLAILVLGEYMAGCFRQITLLSPSRSNVKRCSGIWKDTYIHIYSPCFIKSNFLRAMVQIPISYEFQNL